MDFRQEATKLAAKFGPRNPEHCIGRSLIETALREAYNEGCRATRLAGPNEQELTEVTGFLRHRVRASLWLDQQDLVYLRYVTGYLTESEAVEALGESLDPIRALAFAQIAEVLGRGYKVQGEEPSDAP